MHKEVRTVVTPEQRKEALPGAVEGLEAAGPGAAPEWEWLRRQPLPCAQKYPLEVLTALALGARSPQRGYCEADRVWLARRCGLGRSTLHRALAALLALGLLEEWSLPRNAGSLWRINPAAEALAKPKRKQSPRGATRRAVAQALPDLGALPIREPGLAELAGLPSQIGNPALPIRGDGPPKVAGDKSVVSRVTVQESIPGGVAPPETESRVPVGEPPQQHQPPRGRPERRAKPRGRRVVWINVRGYGDRGQRVLLHYSVTEDQQHTLGVAYPGLGETAVRERLKDMERYYGKASWNFLRERKGKNAIWAKICEWMDQEQAKVLRKTGTAQTSLPTGTEG